jgi:hypothetical protein
VNTVATPQSQRLSPELRTCARCGRQRPLADLTVGADAWSWRHRCLDEAACDAAALAASKGRAGRLLHALLHHGDLS